MKACLFTLLMFANIMTFGQDSLSVTHKLGYKKWTDYRTSIRFGVGVQKAFFSEIGLG